LWLAVAAGTAFAQDDEPFDRTPQECVSTAQIERTRVLDDQTILFLMRNDRAYRNLLPRTCPGLARQSRFSYKVTGGRLCSVDTITVLEQWAGRLEAGFTCGLGEFHPVSPEEIEDLEAVRTNRRQRDAVEAQPVERPERAAELPTEPERDPQVQPERPPAEN
jgi:hypothetical protein